LAYLSDVTLQFHKQFKDYFGKEVTASVGEAICTIALPFTILSHAKNIPAIRQSMPSLNAQDLNMINKLILKPFGTAFDKSVKNIANMRDFLYRLVERFFKAPVGTAMFLINKIMPIYSDKKRVNEGGEPNVQSDWPIVEEQHSNSHSSNDKTTLSEHEVINQSLVILILSAIFLILLDWRRQRMRVRMN
jgi:hypothetical protein